MKTVQPLLFADKIVFSQDVAFTVTAASDLLNANAHGLKQNQIITVASDDTLPAGLSSSAFYYVVNPTTNSFQVSLAKDGVPVDITNTGTGNHNFDVKGVEPVFVDGFENIGLEILSDNALNNYTIKFVGSFQEDMPNFFAASSETNRWQYIAVKDLNPAAVYSGSSGLNLSGAFQKMLEVNANKLRWFGFIISSYTAGDITALVNLSDKD